MRKNVSWIALLVIFLLIQTSCAAEVRMPDIDLKGSEWWVEDIDSKGVIDSSHTTLHFLEQGTVAGDTGCNRYHGSVEIDGSHIKFGPMAGTRMACGRALMDQEMKFYQASARVVSWDVPDTGLLHLKDSDGRTVIRASRVES